MSWLPLSPPPPSFPTPLPPLQPLGTFHQLALTLGCSLLCISTAPTSSLRPHGYDLSYLAKASVRRYSPLPAVTTAFPLSLQRPYIATVAVPTSLQPSLVSLQPSTNPRYIAASSSTSLRPSLLRCILPRIHRNSFPCSATAFRAPHRYGLPCIATAFRALWHTSLRPTATTFPASLQTVLPPYSLSYVPTASLTVLQPLLSPYSLPCVATFRSSPQSPSELYRRYPSFPFRDGLLCKTTAPFSLTPPPPQLHIATAFLGLATAFHISLNFTFITTASPTTTTTIIITTTITISVYSVAVRGTY